MAELEKACPECGRELVIRTNRATGEEFIGCVGYPSFCQHTEPLPESIKMRRAGATPLPFME